MYRWACYYVLIGTFMNSGHGAAWGCWDSCTCCGCCDWVARCAAIQLAPQGSLLVSRSTALTARTSCGERASMIALVSPLWIAIGRNADPIGAPPRMPHETLEAAGG